MRWSLVQTLAPTAEPVTLDELKAQARIDADLTDEDALLQAYIVAARQQIETETGRQLMQATYVLRLDCFPRGGCLPLPRPPLVSLTSLDYIDTAGVNQTWASSNYLVDPYADPGAVHLAFGVSWPSTQGVPNAVTLTYVTGYGDDPSEVPQPLRIAILLMAAELYAHRELSTDRRIITAELPMSAARLIWPYRTAAVLVA
jgi:uncharacterized phiE125 gp8 family phage protein